MRCRHCGKRIDFDVNRQEWLHEGGYPYTGHNALDRTECWIMNAAAGTLADPQDPDTLTEAEANRDTA